MNILVEIIPNIWISNIYNITNNLEQLYNIKNIINTDTDLKHFNRSQNYNHSLRDRILKFENLKKYEYYIECIKYITQNVNNNGIIIYSNDLKNSISIVISYIIVKGQLTFQKSDKIIKSKLNKIIILEDSHKTIINQVEKNFIIE